MLIFNKNISLYGVFNDQNFYDTLTKNMVSFDWAQIIVCYYYYIAFDYYTVFVGVMGVYCFHVVHLYVCLLVPLLIFIFVSYLAE